MFIDQFPTNAPRPPLAFDLPLVPEQRKNVRNFNFFLFFRKHIRQLVEKKVVNLLSRKRTVVSNRLK